MPEKRRSIQEYIDETPIWDDHTKLSKTPLTAMQWRIWWLASVGKFFEGMVIFITGVALPLLVIEFQLTSFEKGMLSAATLAGIMIGATALGNLADIFGRKKVFIGEMALFILFLIVVSLSLNLWVLLTGLFGLGLALGCDYPTAHMIISETIPSKARGRLVLGAFSFQAMGAITGTLVSYLILSNDPKIEAWRWMYAVAIVPAILVMIGRLTITESPHWLNLHEKQEKAEAELLRLLKREPQYPKKCEIKPTKVRVTKEKKHGTFADLFKMKNIRSTVLASIPWFLQDLGTYGIGIFTPTILAVALGSRISEDHSLGILIQADIFAAKGAAFVNIFLLLGMAAAVFLVDRLGRIKLQIIGFFGCAIGLLLAALSIDASGGYHLELLFLGFILFNFMTNMGPNSQTYLLAGEVFPLKLRAKGSGFAASFAKIGAVTTAFLFPLLLHIIGTFNLLLILIGTSLLGALVTYLARKETRALNLEEMDL